MSNDQPRNPLHGVKLEQVVTDLVDTFGWETLAEQVNINCFRSNPTVKSSLKFLRKTQWARDKVESLYVYAIVRGKPLKPQFNTSSRGPAEPSVAATPKPSTDNSHIWKTPS
ncbi:MAG TPA: hypothetical protein DE045_00035 [Oceanospirillaceae bacterium]|nr:hypothetical protein [Oceanospirillaceae bacterium]